MGLDDLLTMMGQRHALQEQIDHVENWRSWTRVMGLADLALSMGKGYGTQEFLAELEKIMRVMANSAAQASALRAKDMEYFLNMIIIQSAAQDFSKSI